MPRAGPLSPSFKENRSNFRRSPHFILPSRSPLSPLLKDNTGGYFAENNSNLNTTIADQKARNRTPTSNAANRDVRRREKALSDVKRGRFWGEAQQETAHQHRLPGVVSSRDQTNEELPIPRESPKSLKHLASRAQGKPQNKKCFQNMRYDSSTENEGGVSDRSLWASGHIEDQSREKASLYRGRALFRENRLGILKDGWCTKEKCNGDGSFGLFTGEGCSTMDVNMKGSEDWGHIVIATPGENHEGAVEGKRDLIPTEKNPTPPMQPTSSPDFKRGARSVVQVGQGCFGAGLAMVKDKRRCKPRGVLIVENLNGFQSSIDSEMDFHQSVQLPGPAVASVEWMVDEDDLQMSVETSSEFTSCSMDFCRMSLQRLSVTRFDSYEDKEDESEICNSVTDLETLRGSNAFRASMHESGFDLEASSSQVFDEEVKQRHPLPSSWQESVLPEKLSRGCFKEDFCYEKTWLNNLDEYGSHSQEPWANSPQKEILTSLAKALPPLDISISSYEQDSRAHIGYETTGTPTSRAAQLLCEEEAQDIHMMNCSTSTVTELHDSLEEMCPSESQLSSRIARAELLCSLTAAYVEKLKTEGSRHWAVETQQTTGNGSDYVGTEVGCNIPEQESKSPSVSRGRGKMDECQSLLRGLTYETSLFPDNSSMFSDGSVNQPSPCAEEDTADSSLCFQNSPKRLFTASEGRHSTLPVSSCRRSYDLDSDPSYLEEILIKMSETLKQEIINPRQEGRWQVHEEAWNPSRATLAVGLGIVVVSYAFYRHLKNPGKK